jgi:hypothetical protein
LKLKFESVTAGRYNSRGCAVDNDKIEISVTKTLAVQIS